MAKKTTYHAVDKKGRAHMRSHGSLPKGMRGVDPEYDVHTFTEGPLSRLFSRRRR